MRLKRKSAPIRRTIAPSVSPRVQLARIALPRGEVTQSPLPAMMNEAGIVANCGDRTASASTAKTPATRRSRRLPEAKARTISQEQSA